MSRIITPAVRSRNEPHPLDPEPVSGHILNRDQQFESSLNNLRRSSSPNHNVANPSRRSMPTYRDRRRALYNPNATNRLAPSPPRPQPSRTRRQARQHKPTTHRPTTSQQEFAYHVRPRIAIAAHPGPLAAIAATLEIALLLSTLSCGSKTPPPHNPAPQPTPTPSPYPPPPQVAPHPQPNPSP